MHLSAVGAYQSEVARSHLSAGEQWMLAIACVLAGIAPFAAHWIPDEVIRVTCGLLLAVVYLGVAFAIRASESLRQFWELAFAFFVLACVLVLNNTIPGYVGTYLLNSPPDAGNPLASTISGTLVVQVLGTAFSVGLVIALTLASRGNLESIYVRPGKPVPWLVVAMVFFVGLYILLATLPLRPDSPAQRLLPTNGPVTVGRLLSFTPALLIISLANGFEEEFLTRSLFLKKYNWFFKPPVANVLQAMVFSSAHAGVAYTPSAALFIVVFVFPLGLFAGYLMRATDGVLASSIFHGALDMAIYLPFLSFAS
jgi:membrane protease YdiL (CAAX protease family)